VKKFVTPFKVGLLVIIAGVAFIAFFTFTKKSKFRGESLTVWALFKDASGLGNKSRVQVAGITVGEIADISLEGTKAKVTMRVSREVPLHTDASIAKRSESMLGDFMLDLYPGSDEAPMMPDGGQIKVVYDKTGLDQTFDRLNTIATDIQDITSSLRGVLGGKKGAGDLQSIMENMTRLSGTMDKTVRESGEKLNVVLGNLEGATGAVKDLTTSQEEDYRQIVSNVRAASEDVRDVLKTIKQVLGTGEGGFKESVAGVRGSLEKLDRALERIDSIAGKVDQGQGALGALVNDPEIKSQVAKTVDDASTFVGKLSGLMAEVSLRSEYHWNQRGVKNYLQLKVIPKPDKYYYFEVITDPRGYTTEQTVERLPPGSTERELQTVVTTQFNQLKFSAEFAKRYYFLTLRFGIVESTGGMGANLHFLNDSLTITVDMFDFAASNKDYPRLKAFANYSFLGHLFVSAGVDDALNRTLYDSDLVGTGTGATRRLVSGRDFFLGAGLYFTDDDLKSVLGLVGLAR
jgi:phospholipid/cholesterol/gamma-HCH transport system substrate-binding protein